MIAGFIAIAGQTARLSLKSGGGAFVGPDLKLLARIGPAMLWIGALLATLLGLDRLFGEDKEDGALDLLVLSGLPLEVTVLAKCAGAWAATVLPLVVVSPVLGLLLGMEPMALGVTTLTLLIGSPALTLIGAIGAALMTALGRGGLLVAVLVLPFTIPVLIFGVSATYAVIGPMPLSSPLLILAALSLVSAVVAPVAGAAALRIGLE
jgi:heme exporter protein B